MPRTLPAGAAIYWGAKEVNLRTKSLLLANIREARTLSGIDPSKVKILSERCLDEFVVEFQAHLNHSLEQSFPGYPDSANAFIKEVSSYDSVGSFLTNHRSQRAEIAAFGLVLIDRFVIKAESGADGWDCIIDWDGICECMSYVYGEFSASSAARAAAEVRHIENREMKREALQHYAANIAKYKSMDSAAEAIAGKVVPMTFRTVRDWISEYRKEMRSPRRP